jgi:glycosyltransferase involved in cell wall biosynthesis
VLIACRADFRSADEADFEVLQNAHFADNRRSFFIPVWPQPGLIARDPSRGTRVENVAFKGHVGNLLPALREEPFARFLAEHGMRLELDTVVDKDVSHPVQAAWHDYSRADVVLALRPGSEREHTHKPATKLYNAWLAGVPAILSPDLAFRELRRGSLDYLEARTADEARAALLRLKTEPGLYAAMVENGQRRGREFSPEAVAQRWETLLYATLPPLAARIPSWRRRSWGRRFAGAGRKLCAFVTGASRK